MPTVQINLRKIAMMQPESNLGKLYQILGESLTEKVLTIFAGLEIRIPGPKDLLTLAREEIIYTTLQKVRGPAFEESVKEVAQRTGWSVEAVKATYKELSMKLSVRADSRIW